MRLSDDQRRQLGEVANSGVTVAEALEHFERVGRVLREASDTVRGLSEAIGRARDELRADLERLRK